LCNNCQSSWRFVVVADTGKLSKIQKEVLSFPGHASFKKVNKGLNMVKKVTELDNKFIQKSEQKKVLTIKQLFDLDNNEVKNSKTVDSKPKRKYDSEKFSGWQCKKERLHWTTKYPKTKCQNEVSEVSPKKQAKAKITIKQQSISPQKLPVSKKYTQKWHGTILIQDITI